MTVDMHTRVNMVTEYMCTYINANKYIHVYIRTYVGTVYMYLYPV